MSEDRTEEDTAFDADQLAALARPSLPPTQKDDDDDDDDDSPLDLKALTASMAPPAADDGDSDDDEDDDDSRVSIASGPASSGESADAKSSATKSGAKTSSSAKSTSGKSSKKKKKKKSSGQKSSENKATEKSAKPASDDDNKAAVAVAAAIEAEPEPQTGGSGKMLIGLIALLGIGGVAFALTQGGEPEEHAARYPPAESTAARQEPVAEELTEPTVEVTPEETRVDVEEEVEEILEEAADSETEPPAAATPEPDTTADEPRARTTPNTTAMEAATPNTSAMEAAPEPEPATETPDPEPETMAAEPTMETTSMDDMDDLLTRALGGTPTAGGTMTEATMEVAMEDRSALPDTPSRAAVTRALGGLMPRMRRCAGDQVGMATARIRVNNDGQVISANISGSPFGGTPQGTCMEGVVQTARFPRFQRTHFDVTYPFSIRAIR